MKKAASWAGVIVAVFLLTPFIFWDKVQETRAFINAAQAYVYGFPMVMMDVTKSVLTASNESTELKAPITQFARIRTYVTPEVKDVVRISVSSLWSHGFIDLDQDAWIVSYPDTGGRYMVIQAMNMWTDNFLSAGSRTTGTGAGNILIAGPNWSGTPAADVKEISQGLLHSAIVDKPMEIVNSFHFLTKAVGAFFSAKHSLPELTLALPN